MATGSIGSFVPGRGANQMQETVLEVRVPTHLLAFGLNRDGIQHRLPEWIVFSLFQEGRVSSGKAAQLLGMDRVAFLVLLRTRGIAYIDYSPEELAEEFSASERFTSAILP